MKTILFLCTGNYYRSRFAEELFNHRATRDGLPWRAFSRALAIERGASNVGPISPLVLAALEARGLAARRAAIVPQSCAPADLAVADRIVALQDAEHRPLMSERFPEWEGHTEFWQVGDVDVTRPPDALALIEQEIEALVARLREGAGD